MSKNEDEFKKLCDEHGLSEDCKFCSGSGCVDCGDYGRIYPTLSGLLDMVEEKWYFGGQEFRFTKYNDGRHKYEFKVGSRFIAEAWGVGNTRKLAVLNAWIGEKDR